MQTSAIGPALKYHSICVKMSVGKFMARGDTLLSLANVHAINENGQRFGIDGINHQTVNVEALRIFRCRSGEVKYRYFCENSREKVVHT